MAEQYNQQTTLDQQRHQAQDLDKLPPALAEIALEAYLIQHQAVNQKSQSGMNQFYKGNSK